MPFFLGKMKAAGGYDNLDSDADSDSSGRVVAADDSSDEDGDRHCEDEVRGNIIVSLF